MPRLLHVSDTHLGLQAYARLTAEGLNQREVDLHDAFARVVDAALADPPDLVVHAGDLFDHPRPSNRAIAHALHQVRRLSDAGIPTVLVSGNHDAPRMRETGSIFRIFEGLPNVHAVYRGAAEQVRVGDLTVHAVPQGITQEAFRAQLDAVAPRGTGVDVLVVHGTVLGVDGLFTSEFNEYQIPQSALKPAFDYVALGHFHNFKRVAENAYYAGSTEYCSFNEAGQEKVYLDVTVGEGDLSVAPRPTGARPMEDLGVVDARDLEPDLVAAQVRQLVARARAGAVARATVDRLPRATGRAVDWEALRHARTDLCHLDVRLRWDEEEHQVDGGLELDGLAQEFTSFLGHTPLPEGLREEVRREAEACLAAAGGVPRAG